MIRSILIAAIFSVFAANVGAQEPARRMRWCAAMMCEEEAVLSVALDSVIRETLALGQTRGAPRVLGLLVANPFYIEPGTRVGPNPVVMRWNFVRQIHPEVQVLDSVGAAFARGGALRAGGPLFVVAPLSWRGDSSAVVQIAVLPASGHFRHERYVRLRYRDGEWRIVRIETGWIE